MTKNLPPEPPRSFAYTMAILAIGLILSLFFIYLLNLMGA